MHVVLDTFKMKELVLRADDDLSVESVPDVGQQCHDSSLYCLGDTQSQPETGAAAQVQEEHGHVISWEAASLQQQGLGPEEVKASSH